MDSISPVSSIPTNSYVTKEVVHKTREGKEPGTEVIESTVYEVVTYDRNGRLETITNVHQTEYLV